MTKRYFITCPLQAAMAAEYHGFKFEDGLSAQFLALDAATQIRDKTLLAADVVTQIRYKTHLPKYCIHPDSEHLLQPQDGDIVITQDPDDKHRFQLGYWEHVSCYDLLSSPKIIQRNGKPFPQFESEDV